jgi:hypothetical protein
VFVVFGITMVLEIFVDIVHELVFVAVRTTVVLLALEIAIVFEMFVVTVYGLVFVECISLIRTNF